MVDRIAKQTSEGFGKRQRELDAAGGKASQRSLRHIVETVAHTGG